ncbi:hypothetical protein LXL04_011304 [Taraxacum kok-saghyz]
MMMLFSFWGFSGAGIPFSSFLPYFARLALRRNFSIQMLLRSISVFLISKTLINLVKPNLLPALFLLRATKTSTTIPTLLNSCHSLASFQCSGKLVKKKVVALPPRLSLFRGEEVPAYVAAVFILFAHDCPSFLARYQIKIDNQARRSGAPNSLIKHPFAHTTSPLGMRQGKMPKERHGVLQLHLHSSLMLMLMPPVTRMVSPPKNDVVRDKRMDAMGETLGKVLEEQHQQRRALEDVKNLPK